MIESSDEVPSWAKLWLDDDVAAWLHEQAALYFDGNVERALNAAVRAVMAMSMRPQDPWAAVTALAEARRAAP